MEKLCGNLRSVLTILAGTVVQAISAARFQKVKQKYPWPETSEQRGLTFRDVQQGWKWPSDIGNA